MKVSRRIVTTAIGAVMALSALPGGSPAAQAAIPASPHLSQHYGIYAYQWDGPFVDHPAKGVTVKHWITDSGALSAHCFKATMTKKYKAKLTKKYGKTAMYFTVRDSNGVSNATHITTGRTLYQQVFVDGRVQDWKKVRLAVKKTSNGKKVKDFLIGSFG